MFLPLLQYSVFASIFTVGAMVGATVSGKIADLVGRRGVFFFAYTVELSKPNVVFDSSMFAV